MGIAYFSYITEEIGRMEISFYISLFEGNNFNTEQMFKLELPVVMGFQA